MNGFAPSIKPPKEINERRQWAEDTLQKFLASNESCVCKEWPDFETNYFESTREMTNDATMLRSVIKRHGYECYVTVRKNKMYIVKGSKDGA